MLARLGHEVDDFGSLVRILDRLGIPQHEFQVVSRNRGLTDLACAATGTQS